MSLLWLALTFKAALSINIGTASDQQPEVVLPPEITALEAAVLAKYNGEAPAGVRLLSKQVPGASSVRQADMSPEELDANSRARVKLQSKQGPGVSGASAENPPETAGLEATVLAKHNLKMPPPSTKHKLLDLEGAVLARRSMSKAVHKLQSTQRSGSVVAETEVPLEVAELEDIADLEAVVQHESAMLGLEPKQVTALSNKILDLEGAVLARRSMSKAVHKLQSPQRFGSVVAVTEVPPEAVELEDIANLEAAVQRESAMLGLEPEQVTALSNKISDLEEAALERRGISKGFDKLRGSSSGSDEVAEKREAVGHIHHLPKQSSPIVSDAHRHMPEQVPASAGYTAIRFVVLSGVLLSVVGVALHKHEAICHICEGTVGLRKIKEKQDVTDPEGGGFISPPRFAQHTRRDLASSLTSSLTLIAGSGARGLSRRGAVDTKSYWDSGV